MKRNDIITLGRHTLMCGDATSFEDVEALINGRHIDLVLTDPPYGIRMHHNYKFTNAQRSFPRRPNPNLRSVNILGDKDTTTARSHYAIIESFVDRMIIWGGQYFTDFLPPQKGWLVWHKKQTLWNHSQCELAWTSLNTNTKNYEQTWNGAIRKGNCSLNPRPAVHPTQKPVELHMRILEDFSKPGDVILDCFGGSGTTLIACEMTGRTCLMMELSPEYCDIIKQRYEKLTEGTIRYED